MSFKYIAGFIGAGNMGSALLEAVAKSLENKKSICVYDLDYKRAMNKAEEVGVVYCGLEALVSNSRYIFIGVKPNTVHSVLEEIKPFVSDDSVIVSMAAGVDISTVEAVLPNTKVIRIMPNTPVSSCEGVVLYTYNKLLMEADVLDFRKLMMNAGYVDYINEKLIDAAAALSGCGPAFVYMFIDALADGAVKCGLPRDKALIYAKRTVLGSAKLALESDKHPDKLKDEVCSPGGTTIEGVLALEKGAFRHNTSSAVIAAFEKTKLL